MGTTAQKLEYLGTTKSQLKDMINYGLPTEEQITSNTTFRNYVKSIFNAFLESLNNPSTLFNNLPKITGSGSNITLNGTANAPMRIELGATELTQAGTPTPSSPQDIHTISGSNTIKVLGKNLLSDNFNDYTLSTGNYGYIQVSKENEPLTLSITDKDTSIDISGCYFGFTYTGYNSSTGLNWILNGGSTPVATSVGNTQRNLQYISFYPKNEATFNKIFSRFNVMVEKGTTASTYEPYQEQTAQLNLGDLEYSKIGNHKDQFIRTSGKNMFDKSTITTNYYYDAGLNYTSTSDIELSDYIEVESGKSYTISYDKLNTNLTNVRINLFNNNKVIQQQLVNSETTTGRKTYTFSIPSGINYVRFSYTTLSGYLNTNTIMFNQGEVLDYEPYGSNEWYLKKNIVKVVFNGNENWTWADTTRYALAIDKASERNALCNYYTYVNYTGSSTISPSFDISSSLTAIGFHNTDLTSLTNFKNDLQAKYNNGTPVIVYYPLATPTYTPITETLAEQLEYVYQLLKSYKGQTNISQINNDLPFVITSTALKDLEA